MNQANTPHSLTTNPTIIPSNSTSREDTAKTLVVVAVAHPMMQAGDTVEVVVTVEVAVVALVAVVVETVAEAIHIITDRQIQATTHTITATKKATRVRLTSLHRRVIVNHQCLPRALVYNRTTEPHPMGIQVRKERMTRPITTLLIEANVLPLNLR
jgi:uncharacterized membrane protein